MGEELVGAIISDAYCCAINRLLELNRIDDARKFFNETNFSGSLGRQKCLELLNSYASSGAKSAE